MGPRDKVGLLLGSYHLLFLKIRVKQHVPQESHRRETCPPRPPALHSPLSSMRLRLWAARAQHSLRVFMLPPQGVCSCRGSAEPGAGQEPPPLLSETITVAPPEPAPLVSMEDAPDLACFPSYSGLSCSCLLSISSSSSSISTDPPSALVLTLLPFPLPPSP